MADGGNGPSTAELGLTQKDLGIKQTVVETKPAGSEPKSVALKDEPQGQEEEAQSKPTDIVSSKTLDSERQRLTGLGFEEIAPSSDIFHAGSFYLELDQSGKISTFFKRFKELQEESVVGVIPTQRGNETNIVAIGTDARGDLTFEPVANTSVSMLPFRRDRAYVQRVVDYSRITPIAQQLSDAGFTRSEKSPSVFSKNLETDRKAEEIIVNLTGGQLTPILTSERLVDEDHHEVELNDIEIVAHKQVADTSNGNYLVARDANSEFVIDTNYGLRIVPGSRKSFQEIPDSEFSVKTPEVFADVGGLNIFGANSTERIRSLKELNGVPIPTLEADMRPHGMSGAGFLGENESLLGIMAEDNDFVLSQGLTHQDLAYPLKVIGEAIKSKKTNEVIIPWEKIWIFI